MLRSVMLDPDRLVKTHFCFGGQPWGIQLKVRDNEVIGLEPQRSRSKRVVLPLVWRGSAS